MANDCIVTTLKKEINNSNLEYFDGLIVDGITGAATKNLQFDSDVVYHAKVLSGTSPLPNGDSECDFTYSLSLAGGDYKLLITSLDKMTDFKLYGSCKCSLKQVLRQKSKDSFVGLIFNAAGTLEEITDISEINGINLSVLRVKDRKIKGNIADFAPCTKIIEIQVDSPDVVGSINDFANGVYPVRDYSTLERTIIRANFSNKISYNNGTTDVLLDSGWYAVYFKSGGYEIWTVDTTAEHGKVTKLYDSAG